jgi:hypothetical protein
MARADHEHGRALRRCRSLTTGTPASCHRESYVPRWVSNRGAPGLAEKIVIVSTERPSTGQWASDEAFAGRVGGRTQPESYGPLLDRRRARHRCARSGSQANAARVTLPHPRAGRALHHRPAFAVANEDQRCQSQGQSSPKASRTRLLASSEPHTWLSVQLPSRMPATIPKSPTSTHRCL